MKSVYTLVLLLFIYLNCFSQSLEGEWKGSFEYDAYLPVSITYPIKLFFVLNKDSSYKIYSYSKGHDRSGKDTIIVCKVLYKRLSGDSLYLEETEVLKPKYPADNCFQKMYLKIRPDNKSILLEGTWESTAECRGIKGWVKFKKKN